MASARNGTGAWWLADKLTQSPTVYGGYVKKTTLATGSQGGFSVEITMQDRVGNAIKRNFIEKCD